jgi:hypothetical protein
MPRMSRSAIVAIGSSLVTACGANVQEAKSDAGDAAAETSADTEVFDTEPFFDTNRDTPLPDGTILYGGPPKPDPACDATATKLSELVTADACAAIVRLSYETLEHLGWQIRCDAPGSFTEASARMELTPFVAPMTPIGSYEWRTTPSPDPWLLFSSPGDFGGVGVGAFHSGKLIFAGDVVWAGRGEIKYPSAFRPGSELTMECGVFALAAPTRKFLPSGEMKDFSDVARDRVLRSPLPYALNKKHARVHAWVLGYPRTVGMLDPKSAEWIVVLESAK